MIAAHVIRHVEILLETGGRTREQISALTGVGLTTVSKVATGAITSSDHRRVLAASDGLFRDVVPFRCPGCGAMSRLSPCPRCYTEADGQQSVGKSVGRTTVGLELKPEHEARYQEIRRRREAIEANG